MNSSPDINQIRLALERSGYLMEQRLCPVIERRGYLVTPNHEYQDPDTGKSREIDVHALAVVSLYRNTFDDMLTSTLLVACKNNHFPVVTFAHHNYLRGVPVTSISKAGFPLQVSRSNSTDDPEDIE
jgi:hypothetical protein